MKIGRWDGSPELEAALKALGNVLEDIGNINLQQEDIVIQLVTHIKTSRSLRLLICLDTAYPGAAAKVFMHTEEISKSDIDTAGIFFKRNLVFARLRLLGRVFTPDRLKLFYKP